MPDLERWQYGDPLEVAIRREAQSCKGCATIQVWQVQGETKIVCDNGVPQDVKCKKWKAKK